MVYSVKTIVWLICIVITNMLYYMTGFLVQELPVDNFSDADRIHLSPIEDHSARISIPGEVIEGVTGRTPVRLASFLFRNLSGLLPESLRDRAQNDNNIM